MDMAEFKKVWNAHDGWNKCQLIVFDNSGRWVLNERNYHKVYEMIDDGHGNVKERYLPDDPRGYFKVNPDTGEYLKDEHGEMIPDYKDLRDYLTINEELGTLEMKRYFIGQTEDMIAGGSPLYGVEVRHVENVQLMIFCDENNPEARPLYPLGMT